VIPAGDGPRFEWRGVMLDVARHFFGPDDVRHLVDLLARYRFNRLHLHLTDDQGWRIEIESWPRLAEIGGASAVGGGRGGFYTQDEFRALVEYAGAHGIVVVPEIDLPGHVNAALVAYPELAPAGVTATPHTGMEVGFSSLDTTSDVTWRFVEDVFDEVATLTPGPYIHIGGDEAAATASDAYAAFVSRACGLVHAHGKTPIGWEEVAKAPLPAGTIVQHWKDEQLARAAVHQGAQLIMSPARRTYLDMKYDASTKLGLEWAGHVGVRDAYEWDPGAIEGADVFGVEAALWSETLETRADVEQMLFPRLLATAEVAWRRGGLDWNDFRARAAEENAELSRQGVNVFDSSELGSA
jgi:hexosaminidase